MDAFYLSLLVAGQEMGVMWATKRNSRFLIWNFKDFLHTV